MKINLQSKSPWLDDVSLQKNAAVNEDVSLRSGDGMCLFIPVSFLAASSEYLSNILLTNCCSCSNTDTLIHLPSVSGFSLKLLSQILSVGETEELCGEDIEACLENVEDVLELLGCKVQLVTKLSCNRPPRQLKVVRIESLSQGTEFVKEEFKEMVDVFKTEETVDFYSHLEVEKEVGINITDNCHHEKGFGKRKSDLNHNAKLSKRSSMKVKQAPRKEWIKDYQCSLCDLGFFTSVGLERHTRDEHGDNFLDRKFKCDECNCRYYTKNSLEKHMLQKHGNDNKDDQSNTLEITSFQSCDLWEGPFECTMCDYSCNSHTKFSKHWNEKHTEATHNVSFIDKVTSTIVTLNQVFAFIVQCRLCGMVRCANDKFSKAVSGITKHINQNHSDQIGTRNLSDMYSVLQDGQQRSAQPKFDTTVMNSPVVGNTALEKVPAIAEFSTKIRSFCKRGFIGPYLCLSEGCSFVCYKFGGTTTRSLVNHWVSEHGDVKCLLYLDMASFTIINVKIICNYVGYCKYLCCDQLIFASSKESYQRHVLNHWQNSHSCPDDSYKPSMCKAISNEQVPEVTEEEAVALARKPNILSMKHGAHVADNSSKCCLPDCGENVILQTYASHFSQKHKKQPLNGILVTSSDGRKLTCQDLFKFAIQCRLCTHVCVGGQSKNGRGSMRTHWLREHEDKNIEQMSFIDVMPASSGQVKELVNSKSITSVKEQNMCGNEDGDTLYSNVDIDKVSVDDSSEDDQLVAEANPLLCDVGI